MHRLPSVTEVLSPFVDLSAVPDGRLLSAKERGTSVHRFCAAYAEGLPVLALPDEAASYFVSFRDWFDQVVDEVLLVEEELDDLDLGFRGHPDLVVRLRGDSLPSVWDLKTSAALQRTWACQVAAYRHLVERRLGRVGRACVLRLDPHGGRPTVTDYRDGARDFAAFVAALTAWKYFNQ